MGYHFDKKRPQPTALQLFRPKSAYEIATCCIIDYRSYYYNSSEKDRRVDYRRERYWYPEVDSKFWSLHSGRNHDSAGCFKFFNCIFYDGFVIIPKEGAC